MELLKLNFISFQITLVDTIIELEGMCMYESERIIFLFMFFYLSPYLNWFCLLKINTHLKLFGV